MPEKHTSKQAQSSQRQGPRQKKKQTVNTLPVYVFLVALFIVYFVFESNPEASIILGAAVFFTVIVLLVLEIINGIHEEGLAKNAAEIIIAVVLVLVFWLGLRYMLNTSTPLDVVPSCSMLPVLSRGDMIVLQGANIGSIRAPIVDVNATGWNSSMSSLPSESFQCVAYNASSGRAKISQFIGPGDKVGLLRTIGSTSEIVPQSAQQNSSIKFVCGAVQVKFQNGTVENEASTTGITIGNTTINGDKNNSIVVYGTVPQDLFYREGDGYIVHRVYAIVNASGRYYVLTKGDNNPGLDIQYENLPANMSQVDGKVIASIPYVGYLKLILSSSFSEPAGCNYSTLN